MIARLRAKNFVTILVATTIAVLVAIGIFLRFSENINMRSHVLFEKEQRLQAYIALFGDQAELCDDDSQSTTSD